jgi:hypothetical protein
MSINNVVAIMVAIFGSVPTIAKGVKFILDHPNKWKEIIITALIVLIICAGFVGAAVFISKATTIAINGQTNVPIPGLPAATETPIPTPSPIPTQVIPINQTMSCTNCSDPTVNFSLMVKNATFDPAKSQLTLLIGVQNNTTTSQSDVFFTLLSLQDAQTGVTTNGTGDGFNYFDIAANQLILFRPTFQFVPAAGHEYSLSAEVRGFALHMIFSPITIKLGSYVKTGRNSPFYGISVIA